jgi:hypothetical protein
VRGGAQAACGLRLALILALALVSGAPLLGREEEPENGAGEPEGVEAGPAAEGPKEPEPWFVFPEPLADFAKDPTLGGKLHLVYRASYTCRFFDFKSFDFPFPQAVSGDDREYAEELARRRDGADHDLDQYFSATWKELLTAEEGLWQSIDADLSFRRFRDLDGSPANEASLSTFDTFSGNRAFQLYTLSASLEAFERHLRLTAGRQLAREAEWVHFDGATASLRGVTFLGKEAEVAAFGGSRVRFFPRTSASRDGIWGGHVRYWPALDTQLTFSDVYYVDNSFQAELRQSFPALGWLALAYRQINERPESARLDASVLWSAWNLELFFTYLARLGRTSDTFLFDFTRSARRDGAVFFNIGDLEPFDEWTLEARKGFLEYYGVFAGGAVHRLRKRDRKDLYNTDWQEAWVGLDVLHAPWKGFTGRATVRYLHSDLPRQRLRLDPTEVITNGTPDFQEQDLAGDGEPDFLGFELLLEQDFFRKLAAGVVVVFRGYDYRSNYAFIDNLTATSATAYLRWRATARSRFHLSYSYDRDFRLLYPDLEALHTVRLQYIFSF